MKCFFKKTALSFGSVFFLSLVSIIFFQPAGVAAADPSVTLESCTPDTDNNPLMPVFGKSSVFDCTIKNAGDTSSVFLFVTRKLEGSNAEATKVSIPFVELKANESTITQVYVPAVFENGSYVYAITLAKAVGAVGSEKEGDSFGNTLIFTASLDRPSVKISSAKLDKPDYTNGDTAQLLLTVREPENAAENKPYYVEAVSANEAGIPCKTLLHEGLITKKEGIYSFVIKSDPLCKASSIKVQVLSSEGFPTDSKIFAINPLGGENQAQQGNWFSFYKKYVIIAGSTLLFLVIMGIFFGVKRYLSKKRNIYK